MNLKSAIPFWSISALALFILFGLTSGNFIYAFYFLAFFLPVVIGTAWIFTNILIPKYLLKGMIGRFVLYCVVLLIVSLNVEMVLLFVAFLLLSLYDFQHLSIIINTYKWMPVLMYLLVLLMAFIYLVREIIQRQSLPVQGMEKEHIFVRSERKNRQILLDDILFIESMADYVKIILLSGEVVITREKISRLKERMPEQFLRIHRSFVVNQLRITGYTREYVHLGDTDLPISRTYKKEALAVLSD